MPPSAPHLPLLPQSQLTHPFLQSARAQKKYGRREKAQKEISEFDGKILVRKSGTESLLRILVEAKDSKVTETHSKQLTELAQELA